MEQIINKNELLHNPIHHFAEWVVIHLISGWKEKHGVEFPEFENLCKNNAMQIIFKVNGIDLPFLEAMQEVERQLDREVASAAANIIEGKFGDKIDSINSILANAETELKKKICGSLGIQVEEDGD